MRARPLVLVDANAIIEAVRTGCWRAITGQLTVESVAECRDEVLRGSPDSIPGYVPVSQGELRRLNAVHAVDEITRASFKLAYLDADGLDAGEHDLFAHAYGLDEDAWVICSPDRASIRAAVALGFGDRVWSLEELAEVAGTSATIRFRRHFTKRWLTEFRTRVRLDAL